MNTVKINVFKYSRYELALRNYANAKHQIYKQFILLMGKGVVVVVGVVVDVVVVGVVVGVVVEVDVDEEDVDEDEVVAVVPAVVPVYVPVLGVVPVVVTTAVAKTRMQRISLYRHQWNSLIIL